jgi:serine/threonine-protein kinase
MAAEQRLGRYRLLSLLATGGMGEVFLARQEGPANFAKTVVVKRILRHLAQDQGFIDQFLNEAKLAALLQHPNIAQVYGLEHEDETWFIAMEYVHGRSLRMLIEACRNQGLKVPARLAVRLCSQVLQGLHSAHELTDERGAPLGILHRDVTPENILVSFSGQAKLVDFGIAKAMGNATLRRSPPWGKLAYMAPELVRQGPPTDRRADVYSLGVVMHELLTLEKPPNVQSSVETLSLPTTPYLLAGVVPRALDEILAKALALEPDARWACAADMSQALEAWLTATGQTVVPTDVRAFLIDVFGAAAAQTHEPSALAHRGTEPVPLGTAPIDHDLQATTSMPAMRPVAQTPVVIALGIATGVVFLVVTMIAMWGATPSPAAKAVPVEPPVAVVAKPPPVVEPVVTVVTPVAVIDAGVSDAADDDAVDANSKSPKKKVPPRTGKVVFKVNPGVEVFFGNRLLGMTPLKPQTLPVGTLTFVLKNVKAGLTKKVTVKVTPGATSSLRLELKK